MGIGGKKREESDNLESKEERINEGLIEGSKEIIQLDKTELKYMCRYICKISGSKIVTGFFCKIRYKDNLIPVLITAFHALDENYLIQNNTLKLYINGESKIINIDKNSILYSSKAEKYDIIIIKIYEDYINDYLEIDENIFKINSENTYKSEQIYILHFPYSGKPSISYGYGIEQISAYDIKHLCNTLPGSSGGPILSRLTNKIIGIHKACINKKNIRYNIGTFLKFPLNDLNKINNIYNIEKFLKFSSNYLKEIKNEIIIEIKIDKNDINNNIYFLFDGGDNLKELNKINTELYINGDKKEYTKYFRPKKEGLYTILLKFNISIKDCSHMFYNCRNIINIDLSKFNTSNVTNMSNMFGSCNSLISLPYISKWNTKNVTNMSDMLSGCESLKSLPDISKWNTINVINMSHMFFNCKSLKFLPDISKWNTINVINMSHMFFNCKSLKFLSDISKWNTINVNNMSHMFFNCKSLKLLPDISKWNTTNVTNMNQMFLNCKSLKFLPDISKWNTTHVTNMFQMFSNCELLESLPDISKWNTTNVINMNQMFFNCKSLKFLPDISKWNTNHVTNMFQMFSNSKLFVSLHSFLKEKIENKFNQKIN